MHQPVFKKICKLSSKKNKEINKQGKRFIRFGNIFGADLKDIL